jgi:hypothetical protein
VAVASFRQGVQLVSEGGSVVFLQRGHFGSRLVVFRFKTLGKNFSNKSHKIFSGNAVPWREFLKSRIDLVELLTQSAGPLRQSAVLLSSKQGRTPKKKEKLVF